MGNYASRSDVLEFAQIGNPNLRPSAVTDEIVSMAEARVNTSLRLFLIREIPAPEINYLLLNATIAYAIEILNSTGKLRWSTGDIERVRQGAFDIQYQKWQPMFFFAAGSSQGFYNLLPHESWLMVARQILTAYSMAYADSKYGYPGDGSYTAGFHDYTYRGKGALDYDF